MSEFDEAARHGLIMFYIATAFIAFACGYWYLLNK